MNGEVSVAFAVAVAENGVIGANGKLPWRLPTDLKHFRKITLGKPIIMGRKTFASLGKPLDGRDNIVVTRDRAFAAAGVHVTFSVGESIALGRRLAAARGAQEIVIIGGAEIFRLALAQADRVYLTRVHGAPPGDTYLDAFDSAVWIETAKVEMPRAANDQFAADFLVLERKR